MQNTQTRSLTQAHMWKNDFARMARAGKIGYSEFENWMLGAFTPAGSVSRKVRAAWVLGRTYEYNVTFDAKLAKAVAENPKDVLEFAQKRQNRLQWIAGSTKTKVGENGLQYEIFSLKKEAFYQMGKAAKEYGMPDDFRLRRPEGLERLDGIADLSLVSEVFNGIKDNFGDVPIMVTGIRPPRTTRSPVYRLNMIAVVPKLDAESYERHIGFASRYAKDEYGAISILAVPKANFTHFAYSDTGGLMGEGNSAVFNTHLAVPESIGEDGLIIVQDAIFLMQSLRRGILRFGERGSGWFAKKMSMPQRADAKLAAVLGRVYGHIPESYYKKEVPQTAEGRADEMAQANESMAMVFVKYAQKLVEFAARLA